jgi:hypothetical protein
MVKVIAQQERQALRRTKGDAGGPKDDLELEREALLEAARAAGCARACGAARLTCGAPCGAGGRAGRRAAAGASGRARARTGAARPCASVGKPLRGRAVGTGRDKPCVQRCFLCQTACPLRPNAWPAW